ncbi:MAG: hypothetical protein LWX83_14230 [Anaerolineae bacterium]|nr:hypothetical protein [Anaerolineae bacterium]
MRRSFFKILFTPGLLFLFFGITACNILGAKSTATVVDIPPVLAPSLTPTITLTPTPTLLALPTQAPTPRPTLDVEKTTPKFLATALNHLDVPDLVAVYFHQNNNNLIVVDKNSISFYNPNDFKEVKKYDTRRLKDDSGAGGSTENLSSALSNNGEWIALGQWEHYTANGDISQRGTISVVQVGTGVTKILGQDLNPGVMAAPFVRVRFLPDGQLVAGEMDESNGEVHVWNIDEGIRVYSVNALHGLDSIDFSPDRSQFAICDHNGYVELMEISSAKLIKSINRYNTVLKRPNCVVSFTTNGEQLAYVLDDQVIHFWNKVEFNSLNFLPGQNSTINQVAYSSDNQSLASTDINGEIRVWSIKAFKELYSWTNYQTGFNWIKFSPDNRYLFAGGSDGQVYIWRADGGQFITQIEGEAITFSQNGEILASYNSQGKIFLWSLNDFNR